MTSPKSRHKRRMKRGRVCDRTAKYPTKAAAERTRQFLVSQQWADASAVTVSHCPNCNTFHVNAATAKQRTGDLRLPRSARGLTPEERKDPCTYLCKTGC